MMVRFSDIVRIRDKTTRDENQVKDRPDDQLWFSEFDILKMPREEISAERPDGPGADVRGPVTVFYYKRLKEQSEIIRDTVKNGLKLSISTVLADLQHILDHNLIDEMYDFAMCAPENAGERHSHPLDVTFVSLRMGKGMGYDDGGLLELGLAAFLENVGMYLVPDGILGKEGPLDEHEMDVIKGHPEASRQILSSLGEDYQWLGEVALQVHERSDGSGYPKRLKGDQISETSSIIGLADTYVAMIKRRPYRDKYLQTDAIKLIIKEEKGLFPTRVLKVFLDHISLFPVNTLVRLNNKSVGRVISTDHNQPLRPIIELISDGEGNKLKDRQVIRLCDNPLLHIEESLDEGALTDQ